MPLAHIRSGKSCAAVASVRLGSAAAGRVRQPHRSDVARAVDHHERVLLQVEQGHAAARHRHAPGQSDHLQQGRGRDAAPREEGQARLARHVRRLALRQPARPRVGPARQDLAADRRDGVQVGVVLQVSAGRHAVNRLTRQVREASDPTHIIEACPDTIPSSVLASQA